MRKIKNIIKEYNIKIIFIRKINGNISIKKVITK